MSFILQRVEGRKLALSEVHGKLLRIGRGTNAELRSENPAVALEHAGIESDGSGYTITDRGSITGTYVNRKPVESARLAKGDVIEIGDLRIEVQTADPVRPLFLRVSSTVRQQPGGRYRPFLDDDLASGQPALPGAGSLKAPKIDYAEAYRLRRIYFTKVTVVAVLLILTAMVVTQVLLPDNRTAFMPGGVSSAHQHARDAMGEPIGNNCAACHDPFKGVTDGKCQVCHQKEPHSRLQSETPPCMSCHGEHRGNIRLALIDDSRCIGCHADLARHRVAGPMRPELARIDAFGERHPEFVYPPDPDPLRFNHKLHLQAAGVFNAEGKREVLDCNACHKLVESKEKAEPVPLKFEQHCQRCHRLTFDARFPDAEVPHGGDPGLVYGFVVATYSGNRDIAGKPPEEVRRILTARPPASIDERAVLNAEQVIKTKCTLCHDVIRRAGKLAATPPIVNASWFQHARFGHAQHRNIACEACHGSARKSSLTSDVLMPVRKDCVECHDPRAGRTASTCRTCHEYHERSKTLLAKMAPAFARRTAGEGSVSGGGGVGMLGSILLLIVGVLLLVILIPVSIALYQRLKSGQGDQPARPPAAPPQQRVAPPPPAPAASPKAPPAQQPQAPPASQPQAPATPPTAPVRSETNISIPEVQGGTPGGTEMVQWYGMLTCTAGALEGQRWVVEEDGFYIGRDPALSKVVINDGRISKRHVRIVPRNGKVHAIDQSSTNGTFLGKAGGERITDVQLRRGDVIVLADGAATFLYQI